IPDHVIQIEKGPKGKQNDRHRHAQLHHTEDGDLIDHGTDVHSHLLQDHDAKKVPYIVDTDAWEYHKAQIQEIPILDASSETQQCTAYALDPAAACDLAELYGRWTMAAEASLLSLSDETPVSDGRLRGQPLRYRLEQMIRQPDPSRIQAGTNQMETNAWISLASQLQPRSIPVTTTMDDAEADPFDAINRYDDGLDYLELLQREPEDPG
ncbi:unnamed protein product, partial [Prorocentrum cordatum]